MVIGEETGREISFWLSNQGFSRPSGSLGFRTSDGHPVAYWYALHTVAVCPLGIK